MSQSALAKKMVAVMKAVDAVEKSGKNEKQGYKYVKATDVAREVRLALIAQGISFGYSIEKTERWVQQTHSGGVMNFIELWGNVTFADADSGESATYQGVGWGSSMDDKAPYKAMTGLLKYALRMNLMIPDESDPENDSADSHVANGSGKEIVRKSAKAQVGIAENGEPIFDESGELVVIRSAAPPVPQKPSSKFVSGKTVGEVKGRVFFGKAMSGYQRDTPESKARMKEVFNYLGSIGVEKSHEIPENQFEQACQWAEAR